MNTSSWKTTVGGVLSMLVSVGIVVKGLMSGNYTIVAMGMAGLSSGSVGVFARDNDKTSENVGAGDTSKM